MKRIFCVILCAALLSSLSPFDSFGKSPLTLENPQGHLGAISFEKEDVIEKISEYYGITDRALLEEKYTYFRLKGESVGSLVAALTDCGLQFPDPDDPDGNGKYLQTVYVIDNALWVEFKPGMYGFYDEIDVNELFPELEIESVRYCYSEIREEYPDHDWFPEQYSEETFCLQCVLYLKTHDAENLINALEYLRRLDFLDFAVLDYYNFTEYCSIVVGDVNGDGKFNSKDVIALMKILVGRNEKCNIKLADLNSDRKVNSRDVTLMMKVLVKKLDDGNSSAACKLAGHIFRYEYATEVVHNAYSDSPHCVQNKYLIISCCRDGCGYIEKILISSKRITTCHG